MSEDGSTIVGVSSTGTLLRGFRWTEEEGMQDLGALPGRPTSFATAVSGDGSLITGVSFGGAGPDAKECGLK